MPDKRTSPPDAKVSVTPDFTAFALPTAVVSVIFAAILMIWPQWSMRIVAALAMHDRLIWLVPGLTLCVNAAACGLSYRRKFQSFSGIMELLLLTVCATSVAILFQFLVPERASLRSAMFWDQLTPDGFRRVTTTLLAYSYFGVVAGAFVVPLAIAVLREIADAFFTAEPPVEQRPAF